MQKCPTRAVSEQITVMRGWSLVLLVLTLVVLPMCAGSVVADEDSEHWLIGRTAGITCLSSLPEDITFGFMLGAEAGRATVDRLWPSELLPVPVDFKFVVYDAGYDVLTGDPVLPFQPGTYATAMTSDAGVMSVVRYVMTEEKKLLREFGKKKGRGVQWWDTAFPFDEYLDARLARMPQLPPWAVRGLKLLAASANA
ncbi:MAG TPA: hypothetical protein VHF69_02550, partial [Candidatus Synoicihabitans sp.]|nr:hypothetical protein [Candidatus Synoicihabitans sp.]